MRQNKSFDPNSIDRKEEANALHDADRFTVEIKNIGGISYETRELAAGVTPLVGANATKRSSFINGVMAALGSHSDTITVNTAADEDGHVELTVDGETFTRIAHLDRGGGGSVLSGAPVVDDADAAMKADLYAFLHGDNEVRNVIESNGDVYDVLMRPVDTDAIERRITEIKQRKAEIDDELAKVENAKDKSVDVANEMDDTEVKKDELAEQYDELKAEISSLEAELEAAREQDEKSDAEQRLETLEDTIDELESKQGRIMGRIDGWEESKAEAEAELAEVTGDTSAKSISEITNKLDVITDEAQEVDASVEELREAKREIDELIETAVSVRAQQGAFETIKDALTGKSIPDGPVMFTERDGSGDATGAGDVTAGLIGKDAERDVDTGQCLVCGQVTVEEQIRNVIDQYKAVRTELQNRITELTDKREALQEQREELLTEKQRIETAERKRDELEAEITDINEKLDELRGELETVDSELADARSKRDSISLSNNEGGDEEGEVQRIQKALKQKRDERRKVDRELQSVKDELERLETRRKELEDRIDAEDELEAEYDELDVEHDSLRGRVEQKETELVEQFNTHMETVVDAFGYTNLERVWIERKRSSDTQDTSAKNSTFEINIIRRDDTGTVHECQLAHLSESERVVTGILFAVAGYIVHDVADICPVIILDSIEMIDGERVAALLAFLDRHVGSRWTIAALLPDHMTDVTKNVVTGTERFTETGEVTLQ